MACFIFNLLAIFSTVDGADESDLTFAASRASKSKMGGLRHRRVPTKYGRRRRCSHVRLQLVRWGGALYGVLVDHSGSGCSPFPLSMGRRGDVPGAEATRTRVVLDCAPPLTLPGAGEEDGTALCPRSIVDVALVPASDAPQGGAGRSTARSPRTRVGPSVACWALSTGKRERAESLRLRVVCRVATSLQCTGGEEGSFVAADAGGASYGGAPPLCERQRTGAVRMSLCGQGSTPSRAQ